MGWRAVIRRNLAEKVRAYQTANPTLLPEVYAVRPENFTALPAAYIGGVTLSMEGAGNVRHVLPGGSTAQIVLVSDAIDNEERKDALDDLADALVDALWADYHVLGSNTGCEPVRVEDASESVGETAYTAVVITVGNIVIQEGLN